MEPYNGNGRLPALTDRLPALTDSQSVFLIIVALQYRRTISEGVLRYCSSIRRVMDNGYRKFPIRVFHVT